MVESPAPFLLVRSQCGYQGAETSDPGAPKGGDVARVRVADAVSRLSRVAGTRNVLR